MAKGNLGDRDLDSDLSPAIDDGIRGRRRIASGIRYERHRRSSHETHSGNDLRTGGALPA